MEYQNTSFFFIPFRVSENIPFSTIESRLAAPEWLPAEVGIRYMYRYISDKLSGGKGGRQCCSRRLSEAGRQRIRLLPAEGWYETGEQFAGRKTMNFSFRILDLQLYCFSTSVGMIVLELQAAETDPLYLSSMQFVLKNVSKKKLRPKNAPGIESAMSLLDVAKAALSDVFPGGKLEEQVSFFFYARQGEERANILTYLEVTPERYEMRRRDLFYLRRCYNESFKYVADKRAEEEELYASVGDITWGFTPEAAACLACLTPQNEGFLRGPFQRNFRQEYLFMYILLLHQKYTLYHFLTRIGVGTYNDLETLENYYIQLCNFETDYLFFRITEVPQYQELYNRINRAFCLRELYQDVRDPVNHLSELRRGAAEKEQQKRDKALSVALAVLSSLTCFSALADGFVFSQDFFGRWSPQAVRWAEYACIVVVVVVLLALAGVLINLLRPRKK